jgi:hypothetical protein
MYVYIHAEPMYILVKTPGVLVEEFFIHTPRLHNPESGLWSSLSVSLTWKGPGLTSEEGLEPRVGLTARA